jgi:hypothetical protein
MDGWPPQLRHLALMLAASLLSWAGSDLVPWLRDQPAVAAWAAPLVVLLVAALTPLTRQYGVGADPVAVERQGLR